MILHVVNRSGVKIGFVEAKVGMITSKGKVTRLTDRTVFTQGKERELRHRAYDGRLPTLTETQAKKWGFNDENKALNKRIEDLVNSMPDEYFQV